MFRRGKEETVDLETEISNLKIRLMKTMPFYGEVLSFVQLEEDNSMETAATNGKVIKYNRKYMQSLSPEQRNYVVMHELLHIILRHWKRVEGRLPEIWNLAADYVVNGMMKKLQRSLDSDEISIAFPEDICFLNRYSGESVEKIYEDICGNPKKYKKHWSVIQRDLLVMEALSELDEQAWDLLLQQLMANSLKKWATAGKPYYIPDVMLSLIDSRILPWKKLLRKYMIRMDNEEVSYLTPERKYLHMGLILPGIGRDEEEKIRDVWAFIDTSGSIDKNERDEFITQLYRIAKDVRVTMNLVYWHTGISDVYRNIRKKEELLKCTPTSSGGTNPACIYQFLNDYNIEPDVMLILTDGWFAGVDPSLIGDRRKRTIVVKSDVHSADLSYMGEVATLYE